MKARFFSLVIIAAAPTWAADDAHFQTRVWPLLDARCVQCHGAKKQKGDLRLDSREAALKGGDSGPALVPGEPEKSLLLRSVRHAEKDLEMPPKEKLTEAEIAALERWIADGAPWSMAAAAPVAKLAPGEKIGDAWTDKRNPIVRIWAGERLDLWSLKPIADATPPNVSKGSWQDHPIDRFVLAKLDAAKLQPAPEADRRTLARRLFLDLTGLPPPPDEMSTFLADPSPEAYSQLVDRLLASPRYGEHQARAWLDVIRYSDSNGFDWDEFRPLAWRFRDYVIRSFNADKPFDHFIREQLAGDEMLAGPPRNSAEQDALIATGFLRLGPLDNSAGAFGESGVVRNQILADLTETTGSAFLGLTMSCCRCHDHKTDPLSHADHYRLRAFFEPVKFRDDLPLDLAPELEKIRAHNEALDVRIAEQRKLRDAIAGPVKERLRGERVAKLAPDEQALLKTPEKDRDEATKAKVGELEKRVEVPEKELKAALGEPEKGRFEEVESAVQLLKKARREFTNGLIAADDDAPPKATRVLFQGDLNEPREEVTPGFLSALDPNPADVRPTKREQSTGRRTALADWIVSEKNPLTARVTVNRIWQSHFGEGLVATPNDFGLAGARPTHPELLDWLAREFVRQGWSVKKLHRLIVTSAAYRQSAAPGFAPVGQSVRRIGAEALRDSMLAVAGRLQPSVGGPPVWPELPEEVLRANPAFLDDNETKTKGWYPSPREKLDVRSVFLVQKRTVRVPMLEAFDLPENATSCARRNISTVAPQALTLLNSPFATDMSRAFAERVCREAGDDREAQVNRAFALALQRAPAEDERAACMRLAEQRSLPELCRALLNVNEFVYVD